MEYWWQSQEGVDVSTIIAAAEAGHEVVNELPIPPVAYGIIAFAGLMGLLFVTYAFRSLGTRH